MDDGCVGDDWTGSLRSTHVHVESCPAPARLEQRAHGDRPQQCAPRRSHRRTMTERGSTQHVTTLVPQGRRLASGSELPAAGKNAAATGVVRGVFEDAYNSMKSGTLMRQDAYVKAVRELEMVLYETAFLYETAS
jgi:hypothetical protein